jgi:hypothetical protein
MLKPFSSQPPALGHLGQSCLIDPAMGMIATSSREMTDANAIATVIAVEIGIDTASGGIEVERRIEGRKMMEMRR